MRGTNRASEPIFTPNIIKCHQYSSCFLHFDTQNISRSPVEFDPLGRHVPPYFENFGTRDRPSRAGPMGAKRSAGGGSGRLAQQKRPLPDLDGCGRVRRADRRRSPTRSRRSRAGRAASWPAEAATGEPARGEEVIVDDQMNEAAGEGLGHRGRRLLLLLWYGCSMSGENMTRYGAQASPERA